ncbi:hypothetical protein HMPREF1531_00418 [Propionibacterium sp. oral taxon 192 str. F0372]|uniref:DoxX family protein n=1 Tax=Propionibacterium sp. oral taxon 192 TaxID=671222 RepID=UPI00035487D2|nr:DoxX family protein [Propionibacterium sp. oral taxon 192]EPH06816.1 hypothetical protein HMPREF1531_00418 [Propionibacterium sp. oral taxon 192 str. F0372]
MSARTTAHNIFRETMLLLVRLGIAALMFSHAWYRWQIEGINGQVARLQEFHVPAASLVASGTIAFEGIGGILLAIGLFTRVLGLLLATEHILITVLFKWSAGPYLANDGFEYNVAMALLGVLLLGCGAGLTGADRLLFRRRGGDSGIDPYQ